MTRAKSEKKPKPDRCASCNRAITADNPRLMCDLCGKTVCTWCSSVLAYDPTGLDPVGQRECFGPCNKTRPASIDSPLPTEEVAP